METKYKYANHYKIIPIKLKDSNSPNTVNFYLSKPSLTSRTTLIKNRSPSYKNHTFKISVGNSKTNLFNTVHKRYLKIVDGMKKGNKLANEVEPINNLKIICENSFKKPIQKKNSDLTVSTAPNTQRNYNNYNSNYNTYNSKKMVIYEKPVKDLMIVKKLECNESYRIHIKNRVYSADDIRKVIRIQKNFRGYEQREIIQKTERLKTEECSVELFCLLIAKSYLKARIRLSFYTLLKEFPNPFDGIGDEMDFDDQLRLGMVDRKYKINTKEGHNKIQQKNKAKSVYKFTQDKKFFEQL